MCTCRVRVTPAATSGAAGAADAAAAARPRRRLSLSLLLLVPVVQRRPLAPVPRALGVLARLSLDLNRGHHRRRVGVLLLTPIVAAATAQGHGDSGSGPTAPAHRAPR